jgi:hypothetical protein
MNWALNLSFKEANNGKPVMLVYIDPLKNFYFVSSSDIKVI